MEYQRISEPENFPKMAILSQTVMKQLDFHAMIVLEWMKSQRSEIVTGETHQRAGAIGWKPRQGRSCECASGSG